jgi:chromosome segregation ATPase
MEAVERAEALVDARDQLAEELRAVRTDPDRTAHGGPGGVTARRPIVTGFEDLEATASADLSRFEAILAEGADLKTQVATLEREAEALRRRLADAERELHEADGRGHADNEPTRTATVAPLAIADHLGVLEESIDSLRAEMRAASDETAMMEPSESVTVVATAVSAAAEHVERARDALRALNAAVGL